MNEIRFSNNATIMRLASLPNTLTKITAMVRIPAGVMMNSLTATPSSLAASPTALASWVAISA
ncbi:hypothetical protein D3C75_1028920 [compost metagenome]